jgi:hypothetical protein
MDKFAARKFHQGSSSQRQAALADFAGSSAVTVHDLSVPAEGEALTQAGSGLNQP